MTETGEVVTLSDGFMILRFQRHAACAGCKACGLAHQETMEMRMENTLSAQVGDRVEVSLQAAPAAPLLAYGVPFAGLLVGLAAGWAVGALARAGEWVTAVGGLLGAGLGFGALRLLEPRTAKRMLPVAQRIVRQ